MFQLSSKAVHLGEAWATNTVNMSIFRHHGLLTQDRFQFLAFYKDKSTLRLVQRDLTSGSIVSFDLPGTYALDDAHNCISLGCDREGFLHLAYDHHRTPLRYRRSTAPLSVSAWSDELAMTGDHEKSVTYPCFVSLPGDRPLLFLYRDGNAAKGALRIKEWSEANKVWTERDTEILSIPASPPSFSPYWNHPAVSENGSIHLSFVWRCPSDSRNWVSNIDIGYARSADCGREWYSSSDQLFALPITADSSEPVWPTSPKSNLINQTGMAVDSLDRPHIVFYSNDSDGIPQYQHLYFDGSAWRHNTVSHRTDRFVLRGRDTLGLPISRPEIVIDRADRVYLLYRGDLTGDRLVAQRLLPPHYVPDFSDVRVLCEEPLGFSEPVIDRLRWQRDGILSMLIQHTDQPKRKAKIQKYTPMYLAEWDFEVLWQTQTAPFHKLLVDAYRREAEIGQSPSTVRAKEKLVSDLDTALTASKLQGADLAAKLAASEDELQRLRTENRRAWKWLHQLKGAAEKIVALGPIGTDVSAGGTRGAQRSTKAVRQVLAELEAAERRQAEEALDEALSGQPDAMHLARALMRLRWAFGRLLSSRRWQAAERAGQMLDIARLRPNEISAPERVRRILASLAQWEDQVVAGTSSADSTQLTAWLVELRDNFEFIMRSRRWRFGDAIGRLGGLVLRRPQEPLVTEDIRAIFRRARPWRLDRILDHSTRETRFGRRLERTSSNELSTRFAERLFESEQFIKAKTNDMRVDDSAPLVSVIMPTYDRAGVIGEAIQSVVEQHYPHWELLVCDDGSSDDTETIVERFADSRVRYLKLPKGGGAKARNAGLRQARGAIFAYLDSDNIWHPLFLSVAVATFRDNPGRSALYCDFIDFQVDEIGQDKILSFERPEFDHEQLLDKNFIDLNSFAHRRELYDCFGGFDERLNRRQDYDLILKYTWLRDPLHVPCLVTLYQRNERLKQVTRELAKDMSCVPVIEATVAGYFRHGLPLALRSERRKVTILSWDQCRNHFSKPFALAEALSKDHDVQLVAFRFFEEEIFAPLKDVNPSFETAYFPGGRFPEFFDTLSSALDAIRGDVIYVVKPRLPSLGLALLANQRSGIPIILESNDLETVVSNPNKTDKHRTRAFDEIDLADPDLLNPYSDLWSELMDAAGQDLPLLATHNAELDAHFHHKCLYMRNVKDEQVYDPARYDRDLVRADLGFAPEDRVILFGGMLRRHKGIFELIELVKRLNDPRYKLLFVGSRPTPDQERLIRDHGDVVRVLPPQDREAMARINLAADLVVLWLNPDVPASRYQMPYKLTDALAMGTPVIANDVSDLGELGRQGYLQVVPFGDWEGIKAAVRGLFDHPERTAAMRAAGRRLFLRQFSYAAARGNFALMLHRADALEPRPLPVAERFAAWFDAFSESMRGKAAKGRFHKPRRESLGEPVPAISMETRRERAPGNARLESAPASDERMSGPSLPQTAGRADVRRARTGAATINGTAISMVDLSTLESLAYDDPGGIAVVMPCIDAEKGMETARLLLQRAGIDCRIFVVRDTARQGFIKTFNDAAARISAKYIVYLAEDAFPGLDWLRSAHRTLEQSGKSLLAFNDGKWKGRIASFGMVRTDWAKKMYGGPVFFPGYKSHKADNELTVIARATEEFVYDPNVTLVELDPNKKVLKEKLSDDRLLFDSRFRSGFNGLVPLRKLRKLEKQYLTFPYDKEARDSNEDTFIYYRILGNDLYPRHKRGQSLENLRFILEHEPELESCKKKFILNRIIDAEQEQKMMALLDGRGEEYMRIPFEIDEYRKIGFDIDALPNPGLLASKEFETFEDVKKDRVKAALYRLKNNYVMNNNGARNAALRDGRGHARWILPWDGNCFLTREAWERIRADIAKAGHNRYFVVPMARLLSNDVLLNGGTIPEPVEEPQIMFRNDAGETFNEAFCYGRRPKVELLWRLGVRGAWDNYRDDAWDRKRASKSPEANVVGTAGYVARLFSGMSSLDTNSYKSMLQRGFARTEAIVSTLQNLDAGSTGATQESFGSLSAAALELEVEQQAAPGLDQVVTALRYAADEALTRGPHTVTEKTTLPPSGNKHDYWHPAPYWWPNPKTADGLPYIRNDGKRVPGTLLYEPLSDRYDRSRLQRVFDDSLTMALAWKFFGEPRYAEHGARILERFFVDPQSAMTPHLEYGQVRMGHNSNRGNSYGVIEMKDMYYYLDAVRLLREADVLPAAVLDGFKTWLGNYLEWLLTSSQGRGERVAANNHGTCYDLQVAAIAAFLDERSVLYDALVRSVSRIGQQFAPDGSQPEELTRNTTAHYCCFNFQSWINLSELAGRWNVDLWSYRPVNGASLAQGARWLAAHMGKPWPYQQIDAFDGERFLPILFSIPTGIVDQPSLAGLPASKYDVKPCFFPHDGIRPFWNLGSPSSETG